MKNKIISTVVLATIVLSSSSVFAEDLFPTPATSTGGAAISSSNPSVSTGASTIWDATLPSSNSWTVSTSSTETTSSIWNPSQKVLELETQSDPTDPKSLVVFGKLKASGSTSIKSADIVLNYDTTGFDISVSDITAGWDGTALPLKTPNSSIEISNGKISFSVSSDVPFTNKPDGAYLFVAVFKKNSSFDPSKTYTFSIKNNESFIKSPDGVQLLWDDGAVATFGAAPSTDSVVATSTGKVVNTVNTPVAKSQTGTTSLTGSTMAPSVDMTAAKNTKTGAFENTVLAFAFLFFGFAFIRRKRNSL